MVPRHVPRHTMVFHKPLLVVFGGNNGQQAENEGPDDAVNDETFGGEVTFETRNDAHNDETFGQHAQNESQDDAVNDETFGREAAFETKSDALNGRPPPLPHVPAPRSRCLRRRDVRRRRGRGRTAELGGQLARDGSAGRGV